MVSIYLKMPYFIQFLIINLIASFKYIIRSGKQYQASLNYYRSFFQSTGYWKIEFDQRKNTAKYWNTSVKFDGTVPSTFNKTFVKNNFDRFVFKKSIFNMKANTSGSSGNGLSFSKTLFSEKDTWAAYVAFREYHGVTQTDWCGYFCGNMVVNPSSKYVYHKTFPTRQLIFSQYNLSADTISRYIKVLNDNQPKWIHGYPSFLLELIRLARQANLKLKYRPLLITTGSENLNTEQREIISTFFSGPVRDLYCQTEMVAMIVECKNGNYHINEAYSKVNLMPTSSDDIYKVIGNNFNNEAFPLFNYDTEDLVVFKKQTKCSCGLYGRVIESIVGRDEDYLLLPNGSRIGRLDHVFKGDLSVYQAQFIQNVNTSKTQLLLKVNEKSFDKTNLITSLERYLPNLEVELKVVDEIQPEKNGKIKFVKQVK